MKRFVTLFPPAENVHLVKDVGQIPYHMHCHFGYRSTLVCYKNEEHYPYQEDEVKGLKLEFLKDRGSRFYWEKAFVSYLFENSSSIDVLNLFQLTQESVLYGLIYKYLNPDGVLYLKMDMDVNHYRKNGIQFSTSAWKNIIHEKLFRQFLKKVDIVSVETEKAMQLLKRLNQKLFDKSIKIPSGSNIGNACQHTAGVRYEKKENLILTVGRIGIEAKNNELLLKALSKIELHDWKVCFAGPISPDFKPTVERFFKENPDKKDSVIFKGEITDRDELWSYYARAKIFCLTSRWESFAIVLAEAQKAGNYIIGTDGISSIYEITEEGAYGDIIQSDNTEELILALKKCMNEDFYDKQLMNAIINHSEQYDWPLILKKLDKAIKNVRDNNQVLKGNATAQS